ncbi:hypothetical protein HOY82DRAFT_581366 [Tuber indicum]|nr:hypothetical protein HOY82DRAFT_581366 [Tuber indicum]
MLLLQKQGDTASGLRGVRAPRMQPLNPFHSTFVAKSLTSYSFELVFMMALIRTGSSEDIPPRSTKIKDVRV